MAAFQVENGSVIGRGFDSNGLLGKLQTFMTTPVSAGGGGWYLLDANTSASSNPYFVLSDIYNPSINDVYKCVQFLMPSTTGQINVFYYNGWNTSGVGLYGYQPLDTADDQEFLYSFRAGPEFMMVSTRAASTWYYTGIDTFYGISGLLEDASVSATLQTANYSETQGKQIDALSFSLNYSNAIDVSANTYLRIRPTTTTNTSAVEVYSNSTRTTMVASATFTRVVNGSRNIVNFQGVNGSGVAGYTVLYGPTSAADMVFNIGSLQLGSGQGARFTPGEYYFAVDNSDKTSHMYIPSVNFFKVLSVSGDTLNVDAGLYKGVYRKFNAGSKIGAYPHRFVAFGRSSKSQRGISTWIPYYSVLSDAYKYWNQPGTSNKAEIPINPAPTYGYDDPGVYTSYETGFLSHTNPDFKGNYGTQDPGLYEYNVPGDQYYPGGNNSGNRLLGAMRNIKVTYRSNLIVMSTGMTIDSINYLYFSTILGTGGYFLCRDSESLT